MSWRRRWVVLVPGEVAWVERRAREILQAHDDGREHHFVVVPGKERYQAIVDQGPLDVGQEALLGRLLSLECEEPVYTIEGVDEYPYIARFVQGQEEYAGDQEPGALVRSLGCENEWTVEPSLEPLTKPTRTAGLIQGLSAAKVLNAITKEAGKPLPPGYCHIEESHLGVLLKEGVGWLGYDLINLAFRFPLATIYSVTATPGLEFFSVVVMHEKKTVEFVPPPEEATYNPTVHEIMGEREPERILAALGIPKEWFQL